MTNLENSKVKQASILLGALALLAVVAILPAASAQVEYTDSDNPTGPLQGTGWGVGLAVAGVLTGVGVWSAVRQH